MPLSKPAAFVRVVSNKFKASTALHAAPNSSVLPSAKGAVLKSPDKTLCRFLHCHPCIVLEVKRTHLQVPRQLETCHSE